MSPERRRIYNERYHEKHPDAARESQRRYREKHPDRAREMDRRYRRTEAGNEIFLAVSMLLWQ